MVKLKIILINFASFVASIIPIFALVGLYYLIIPAKVIWQIPGGIAVFYSVIAFIIYVVLCVSAFLELNYDGKMVKGKVKNYNDETQDYVDFLTEHGFKYVGIMKNKRTFKKPMYSLVLVHTSRKIHAQIAHFNEPNEDKLVSFSTFWDGTHFVVTILATSDGAQLDVVQRDDKHALSLIYGNIAEIYQLHKNNVKEFYTILGQSQTISSPRQIVEWESQSIDTTVIDTMYASFKLMPRIAIATGIMVLSLSALALIVVLFFGIIPIPDSLSGTNLLILLVLNALLMAVVFPRLMPDIKSKEKTKNNPIDDEINDLLSDMNIA